MKKFDYYITINREDSSVALAVEFAGKKPRLIDRWFYIPVSKKNYDEIYKRFVLCTCYHEPFEVNND